MDRFETLFTKIVKQRQTSNIRFADVCYFIEHLGFKSRQNGTSHRVYSLEGITEIINIQEKDGKAKPYQVKQIANLVKKYKLVGDESDDK